MIKVDKQMNLGKALPSVVRAMIRNGTLKRQPTPLYCEGYQQANIAIVPSSLAGDFGKFAEGNSGAIPLLYTSKPGQYGAPDLAMDSDIRTDVGFYNVIKNGAIDSQEEYLKSIEILA